MEILKEYWNDNMNVKKAREIRLWIKEILTPQAKTKMSSATATAQELTAALKYLNHELVELKKNTSFMEDQI